MSVFSSTESASQYKLVEATPFEGLQAYNLGSFGASFGSRWPAYFRLPPRELQKIGGSKPSFTGLATTPGCTSQAYIQSIRKEQA